MAYLQLVSLSTACFSFHQEIPMRRSLQPCLVWQPPASILMDSRASRVRERCGHLSILESLGPVSSLLPFRGLHPQGFRDGFGPTF